MDLPRWWWERLHNYHQWERDKRKLRGREHLYKAHFGPRSKDRAEQLEMGINSTAEEQYWYRLSLLGCCGDSCLETDIVWQPGWRDTIMDSFFLLSIQSSCNAFQSWTGRLLIKCFRCWWKFYSYGWFNKRWPLSQRESKILSEPWFDKHLQKTNTHMQRTHIKVSVPWARRDIQGHYLCQTERCRETRRRLVIWPQPPGDDTCRAAHETHKYEPCV